MAGKITYDVGFNVNTQGLKKVKSALQDLQSMKFSDLMKINDSTASEARTTLKSIQQDAQRVEDALEKAFNPKLNTINVKTFNSELSKSKMTMNDVYTSFSRAGATGQAAFRSLTSQVLSMNMQIKESHAWLDKMATTLANTIKWNVASTAVNSLSRSVQQAWGFVKSLDGSLNDIRIVTGKSSDEMARFAEQANKAASELGRTTTDYTKAALIYAQQGLSDKEVEQRARITLKAANVTGQSTDDVSEQLTAVWNGYKVTAEEAELYVDRLAAVAATTASDLEELSTGMSKVASAAAAMGVGEEQLAAQLSTIISVTKQAPESVGTALRTVYARISDIKAGIDEDGVDLGRYSGKMAELGFNVLDVNGRLRDMGQVIEEIGGRWEYLTREQQISLAQTMAGQRQYNNLLALFDNFEQYNEALQTAQNSAGTLEKQQAIYMDSTKAHLNELTAAIEGIYKSLTDPKAINGLIDGLTSVAKLVNTVVDSIGGGAGVLSALGVLGFNVFSNQIAGSIQTTINNMQRAKAQEEQFKATLEEIQRIQESGAGNDATKDLLNQRSQLIKMSGRLSPQDFNAAQKIINDLSETTGQVDILKESLSLLEAVFEKCAQNIVGFKGKYATLEAALRDSEGFEKIHEYLQEFLNETDKISPQLEKIKNSFENFRNTLKGGSLNQSQNAFETLKKSAQELYDKISKPEIWNSLSNSVQNTVIKANEELQKLDVKTLSGEQLERRATTAYANIAGVINKEINTANQVFNSGAEEIQKYKEKIKQLEAQIQKLRGTSEKQFSTFGKLFKTQDIVNVTRSFATILNSVKQLSNLGSIVTNKSLSDAEKLSQVVSNLAISVPMLIPAFQALSKTIGGPFTIAIGVAAAALEIFSATAKAQRQKLENELKQLQESIDEENKIQEQAQANKDLYKSLEELNEQYKNGQVTRYQLYNQIDDLITQYGLEGQAIDTLKNKYDDFNVSILGLKSANNQELLNSAQRQVESATKAVIDSAKENDINKIGTLRDFTWDNQELLKNIFYDENGNFNNYGGLFQGSSLEEMGTLDYLGINASNIDQVNNLVDAVNQIKAQISEGSDEEEYFKQLIPAWDEIISGEFAKFYSAYQEANKQEELYTTVQSLLDNVLLIEDEELSYNNINSLAQYAKLQDWLKSEIYSNGGKEAGFTEEQYIKTANQILKDTVPELYNQFKDQLSFLQSAGFNIVEDLRKEDNNVQKVLNKLSQLDQQTLTFLMKYINQDNIQNFGYEQLLKYINNLGNVRDIFINPGNLLNRAIEQYSLYNNLNADKTIKEEEYSQLDSSIKQYYALMADGTYKMIGLANQFYNAINDKKADIFLQDLKKYSEAQNIINNFLSKNLQQKDLQNFIFDKSQIEENIKTLTTGLLYYAPADTLSQYVSDNAIRTSSIYLNKKNTELQNIKNTYNEQQLQNLLLKYIGKSDIPFYSTQYRQNYLNNNKLDTTIENYIKDLLNKVSGADAQLVKAWQQQTITSQQLLNQLNNKGYQNILEYTDWARTQSKQRNDQADLAGKQGRDQYANEVIDAIRDAYTQDYTNDIQIISQIRENLTNFTNEFKNEIATNYHDAMLETASSEFNQNIKSVFQNNSDFIANLLSVFGQDFYGKDELDQIINLLEIGEIGSLAPQKFNELVTNVQQIAEMTDQQLQTRLSDQKYNIEAQRNYQALTFARSLQSSEDLKKYKDQLGASIYNQALIQMDQKKDLEGLDSTQLKEYADYLQEIADTSAELSDNLDNQDEAAQIVAKSIIKMNKGIETLNKNWKDWSETLAETDQSSQQYQQAMDGIQDALSNLLDINKDFISDDFIQNHLDEIAAAAQGDKNAIDSLRDALSTDVFSQILEENGKNVADFIGQFDELKNYFENESIDVGEVIDSGAFLAKLNELAQETGMTAQQINAMLDTIGYEPTFATTTMDVQEQAPQTETTFVSGEGEGPVFEGTIGQDKFSIQLPKIVAQTTQTGFTDITRKVEVPAWSGEGTPQIKAITKKGGSSFASKPSSSGKKSGGSGGKGGKGGSGGGSAAKPNTNQKDKKKPLEDERDIYHDINIQIEKINRNVQRLQKQQDRLYGKTLLDNLSKQTSLLDQQKNKLKEKQQLQKEDLKNQQEQLKTLGAVFDEYGNIANYMQVLGDKQDNINALTNKYNDLVASYNASTDSDYKSALEDEMKYYEKTMQQAQEDLSKTKTKIGNYDNLRTAMEDLKDEIDEITQKEIEINIKKFKYELEIRLDMREAAKDWNKFKREVLQHVDVLRGTDFDKIIADARQNQADVETYFHKENGGSSYLEALTKQATDLRTQIEKIDQTGWSDIYGDNKAQAMSDLKDDLSSLMDSLEDIRGLIDNIDEAYLDTIDDIEEQWDKQIEDYEFVNELLQHNIDLVNLLYGDKNYQAMDSYYQQMHNNSLRELESLANRRDLWKRLWDQAVESGESVAAQKFKQNWMNTINEINNMVKQSIDTLKDQYENTINSIFDKMNRGITNGKGLDYLGFEWDLMNEKAEDYLDTINSAFAIQQTERKYQKALNDVKDIKNQKALKDLMDEQLTILKNKQKITQYDIDRAEKLLQVEQARIALEDMRSAKTTLRLKRDSQGNYSYEYHADNDAIAQAEDDLAAAQNELYNFDKAAYQTNLNELYDLWQEFLQKYKDINLDASLSDEERQERLDELTQTYGDRINLRLEQNTGIRNNLYESAFQEYTNLYENNLQNFDQMLNSEGGMVPMWTSGIQQMADKMTAQGGFLPVCQQALAQVEEETNRWKEKIEETAEVAGVKLDEIGQGVDQTKDKFENLIEANDELLNRFTLEEQAAAELKNYLDNLVEGYAQVYNEAANAVSQLYNFVYAQEEAAASAQATASAYENMINRIQAANAAYIANPYQSTVSVGGDSGSGGGGSGSGSGSSSDLNSSISDEQKKRRIRGGVGTGRAGGGGVNYMAIMATGGYTGEWNSDEGKVAMLHEKELVLNQKDTENLLNTITLLRSMINDVGISTMSRMENIKNKSLFGSEPSKESIEQNVKIDANFPNVNSKREIEEAFSDLVNLAAQKVLR